MSNRLSISNSGCRASPFAALGTLPETWAYRRLFSRWNWNRRQQTDLCRAWNTHEPVSSHDFVRQHFPTCDLLLFQALLVPCHFQTREWWSGAYATSFRKRTDEDTPPASEFFHPCKGKHPRALLARNLDGKILPAFGTTTLDDQSTVLGGHADPETVGPFTGCITWLICSFHIFNSFLRVTRTVRQNVIFIRKRYGLSRLFLLLPQKIALQIKVFSVSVQDSRKRDWFHLSWIRNPDITYQYN